MKSERARGEKPSCRDRVFGAHVVLLCGILFLAPLVAGKLALVPSLLIQALVLLAAILWLVHAVRRGSIELPGGRVGVSAAVFFALIVLSAFGSSSLHLTIKELLNVGCYLLVFLMVAGLGSNRREVYGVLASLSISALVVGVFGLREYLLAGEQGWRVFSTFFNPDFLAGFMVMTLPVVLAWYLSRTSFAVSAVAGLSVLLALANILMTGSRFGALTAVGGVCVFIFFAGLSGSIRRTQWIRTSVLVAPVLVIFLILSGPLAARVASVKAESHSGGFRIHTWRGTAGMAVAHPLNGTGLGTFEISYPRYAFVGYTKLAHNSYIQLAAEAGPPAVVALLVLIGASSLPAVVLLLRRRIRDDEAEDSHAAKLKWTPDAGLMASGVLGGIAASLARNVIDSDWYVTAIGIGFWALLGTAVHLGGPDMRKTFRMSFRQVAPVLVIVAVALVGALSMLAAGVLAGQGNSLGKSHPEAAAAYYQRAVKLDPLNAEYRRRLGAMQVNLAYALSDRSYIGRAERELKKAIRLEPDYGKNYYQLGRIYEYYPKYDEAIRAFEAALDRAPNAPEVMLALARRYEAAGRMEDAVDIWRRMVRVENSLYGTVRAMPELVEPEYIFAHEALGRDYERQGDPVGARIEYERALERIERYQDSIRALGEVLEAGGRRNPVMEEQVEEMRRQLVRRLEALSEASDD